LAQHHQFDRGQVVIGGLRRAFRPFALMEMDHLFDSGAQRCAALLVEEFADCVPQSALTVRVSIAGVARSRPFGHRPSVSSYSGFAPYGSAIPIDASTFVSSASIASASAGEISWS